MYGTNRYKYVISILKTGGNCNGKDVRNEKRTGCGYTLSFGRYQAQMRATPVLRAASATALATAGPTRGSKALGMM